MALVDQHSTDLHTRTMTGSEGGNKKAKEMERGESVAAFVYEECRE